MHPILVFLNNSKTTSVDFSFHSHLIEGVLGCFYYALPHSLDLGHPCPALCEKVVAGLFLPSPASPASAILRLMDPVLQVWADRRMARHELVVPAGD